MSQERVSQLEALLSRVQENRKRVRTPVGMGLVKQPEVVARAPEPAPAPPVKVAQPSLSQTSAGLGPLSPVAEQPKPAPVARPAAVAPPAVAPIRSAPPSPPKPAAAPAPVARAAVPTAEVARPAPVAAEAKAAAGASMAPPISPEESFEPRIIEPEPMREPARPIAQTVSRHSPQVDATFGAMLKRSLSLRPH